MSPTSPMPDPPPMVLESPGRDNERTSGVQAGS